MESDCRDLGEGAFYHLFKTLEREEYAFEAAGGHKESGFGEAGEIGVKAGAKTGVPRAVESLERKGQSTWEYKTECL